MESQGELQYYWRLYLKSAIYGLIKSIHPFQHLSNMSWVSKNNIVFLLQLMSCITLNQSADVGEPCGDGFFTSDQHYSEHLRLGEAKNLLWHHKCKTWKQKSNLIFNFWGGFFYFCTISDCLPVVGNPKTHDNDLLSDMALFSWFYWIVHEKDGNWHADWTQTLCCCGEDTSSVHGTHALSAEVSGHSSVCSFSFHLVFCKGGGRHVAKGHMSDSNPEQVLRIRDTSNSTNGAKC